MSKKSSEIYIISLRIEIYDEREAVDPSDYGTRLPTDMFV